MNDIFWEPSFPKKLNENVIKRKLMELIMRHLNLSQKSTTDEALQQMHFDEDITSIDLSYNHIQNLDNVRFPDGLQVLSLYGNHIKSVDKYWISPSTRITADNSIKTAIRESTRNMAATRIQQNFRRYLIRHHNAALTIQKWYVAQSYRTKGVVFRNSMEQYPSGSHI